MCVCSLKFNRYPHLMQPYSPLCCNFTTECLSTLWARSNSFRKNALQVLWGFQVFFRFYREIKVLVWPPIKFTSFPLFSPAGRGLPFPNTGCSAGCYCIWYVSLRMPKICSCLCSCVCFAWHLPYLFHKMLLFKSWNIMLLPLGPHSYFIKNK